MPLTPSNIRSPATVSSPEDRFTFPFIIQFRHPGYQGVGKDLLFSLPGLDTANEVTGLHYGTAHMACAIIANNAFDGYLTATRDGPRLDFHYDDLLTAPEYWFHVPRPTVGQEGQREEEASETSIAQRISDASSPYCYPIVSSFADWEFPHQYFHRWPRNQIPRYHLDSWGLAQQSLHSSSSAPMVVPTSMSQVSEVVRMRGLECRISGAVEYVDAAHIIPELEADWFGRNEMQCYGNDPDAYGLRNSNNLIALRPDLHRAFDDHRIVIVPKCGSFTVHILQGVPFMARQFHNRQTHGIDWVPVPWLFSRFALAIIRSTHHFLARGIPRRLVRWNSDQARYLEETVSGDQCFVAAQEFRSPKSRSQSPKKRTRSTNVLGRSLVIPADRLPIIRAVLDSRRWPTFDPR